MSPRKLRLVREVVVGLPVELALAKLQTLSKAGVKPLIITLKSAIANAVNNNKLEAGSLKVKNVLVDEGTRMKRQDTSHSSRAERGIIQKRTAHIKVILEGENG